MFTRGRAKVLANLPIYLIYILVPCTAHCVPDKTYDSYLSLLNGFFERVRLPVGVWGSTFERMLGES